MGHYNKLAGGSVECIAAKPGGVFAIAMTLLVLDLKAPALALIHAEARHAIERRIAISRGFYAVGAVLCVFSALWSLGFILLMQLNHVIAPRLTDRY